MVLQLDKCERIYCTFRYIIEKTMEMYTTRSRQSFRICWCCVDFGFEIHAISAYIFVQIFFILPFIMSLTYKILSPPSVHLSSLPGLLRRMVNANHAT